jgi:hypothetical protein
MQQLLNEILLVVPFLPLGAAFTMALRSSYSGE